MAQDFLSDIELYYSTNIGAGKVVLEEEEAHHVIRVMRHDTGDEIYVSDGLGNIYKCTIAVITKKNVALEILQTLKHINQAENISVCIPRIRVQDRLEFAIEKVVELGFTNITVYESDRAIGKKDKTDRWEKIALAAMKQSLRAWLPEIEYSKDVFSAGENVTTILLDQNGEFSMRDYFNQNPINPDKKYRLIIGPEGGFSEKEYKASEKFTRLTMSTNRLRSETAVITAASYISQLL